MSDNTNTATDTNAVVAMLERMLADAKAGTITAANIAQSTKAAIAEATKANTAKVLADRKAAQEAVITEFEKAARGPLGVASKAANKCGLVGFTVTFTDGGMTVKPMSTKAATATGEKSAAGTGERPATKAIWTALVPEAVRVAAEAKLELDIDAAIAKGGYTNGRQDAINSKGDAMRRSILGKLYGATWNADTTALTLEDATAKLA